ncbi:MAG: metallophosphoesterase [Candidatus Zixiibacteriota bacterium]
MLRNLLSSLIVTLAVSGFHHLANGGETDTRDLEKYPIRFAIIGDRTGENQPGIYEQIIGEIERLKPEFVMTVGDHIEGYTSDTSILNAEWKEYLELIKAFSMPVHLTPGNHDITYDDMEETYRRQTGLSPYYSFDYDGVHIVVLDNSRWYESDEMPDEQVQWLISDLEGHTGAEYTLLFYHVPSWYRTLSDGKPDRLHTIYQKYGVDAVFNGHWHSYFTGEYDGIEYTTVGTSGGHNNFRPGEMEYHFAWVTVDSDGISIAPIKYNSVMSWDETPVSDIRYYERAKRLGITFAGAAPVSEANLKVEASPVTVEFHNFDSQRALKDTVRWTVPEGWSVEPQEFFVEAPPAGKAEAEFRFSCAGSLYPLPEVTVSFPYNEDAVIQAKRELRVARQATCVAAEVPPVIDGIIDESIWRSPRWGLLDGDGKPANVDSTEFYFAHDGDNLYLAVRCVESRMDSLMANMTEQDDAIYTEDCVGFLYRPVSADDAVYQLYVNPVGTTYDQKILQGSDGYWVNDERWNGTYEIATSSDEVGWRVEVRIPLAQFGATGASGQKWDFNFRRKQARLQSAGGWQVPHAYDPNGFGLLLFE